METTNHRLWREIAQDNRVLDECSTGSDRILAIVGTSVLEGLIDEVLPRYLVDDVVAQRELLGQRGALAGFTHKIRLAYLLGAFSEMIYQDLLAVAKIRNRFAHEPSIAGFSSARVHDLCIKLRCPMAISRVETDRGVGIVEWSMNAVEGEKQFSLRISFKENEIAPSDPRWQFETTVQFAAFLLTSLPTQRPREPRY